MDLMCLWSLMIEVMGITISNHLLKVKEMIREMVGTDDPGIISLFEKWWDKYKVSLRELDQQVEEAESCDEGIFAGAWI